MKKRCFPGIDPDRLKEVKESEQELESDCLKCHDTGKVVVDTDRFGLVIQSCPDCALGDQRRLDNAIFKMMFH